MLPIDIFKKLSTSIKLACEYWAQKLQYNAQEMHISL